MGDADRSDGATAARFTAYLAKLLADMRRAML